MNARFNKNLNTAILPQAGDEWEDSIIGGLLYREDQRLQSSRLLSAQQSLVC